MEKIILDLTSPTESAPKAFDSELYTPMRLFSAGFAIHMLSRIAVSLLLSIFILGSSLIPNTYNFFTNLLWMYQLNHAKTLVHESLSFKYPRVPWVEILLTVVSVSSKICLLIILIFQALEHEKYSQSGFWWSTYVHV